MIRTAHTLTRREISEQLGFDVSILAVRIEVADGAWIAELPGLFVFWIDSSCGEDVDIIGAVT